MTEHQEQSMLIAWARMTESTWPELALLHAIPNGGHRHIAVAVRMKAEGTKPGVPDVCLPVARGCFHGLYIEMKFGKNVPSKNQKRWIDLLNEQGYYVDVCYSAERAIEVIAEYLALPAYKVKIV